MTQRWKPHVTVAAVIEKKFDGVAKFLLVQEQTLDGLRLNNPAGHLELGESPVQACIRETLEETAFHFQPTALVGVYMSRFKKMQLGGKSRIDTTYLRFAFCGELGPEVPGQLLDHGIVKKLWLTEAEIRSCSHEHRSPLLLHCLDDYLAGKRHALDLITMDGSVYAGAALDTPKPNGRF